MLRTSLLLLATVLAFGSHAQSWCPTGATWTFEYANILGGYWGVQRVEYVGDTIVGGYVAQELRQTHVVAPWGTTDYAPYSTPSFYTRYDEDIVYVWDGSSAYDTMVWYGAAPGDQWHAPGWPDDGNIELTVLDTATVTIQGVPLRRLVVEPIPGWPVDTLYERIGFMQFYLDGRTWFILDMPWNGLMCYSDQDIEYTATGVEDCGLTLSAPDAANATPTRIFPNPGTDQFTLAVSPGARMIEVTDATGCVVIRQSITGDRPMVRTNQLAVGLYFVRVEGSSMPVRWMKQ